MAQNLFAAYLVVGADELKRQTVVERLKGRLDASLSAFNLDERTAAPDMDPTEVESSLNMLPVGDVFRLVVIHDAGRLPKAVAEMLVTYLTNPNPGCVLCLDAVSLAKNTRLYKAVAAVGRRSVIDCTPIKARDLPQYVRKHAQALQMVMDDVAAAELVSRVGEDTTLIDRQLKTLREICGGRVGVEDVRLHVARTAEVKPWEFLDKLAAGDVARALELYRHMPDPSHLALLSLIERRLRELVCARSLIDRGQARDVARALGRQEWQVRSVVSAARRFDQRRLFACLRACSSCEREIKGGADPDASFTRLLLFVGEP